MTDLLTHRINDWYNNSYNQKIKWSTHITQRNNDWMILGLLSLRTLTIHKTHVCDIQYTDNTQDSCMWYTVHWGYTKFMCDIQNTDSTQDSCVMYDYQESTVSMQHPPPQNHFKYTKWPHLLIYTQSISCHKHGPHSHPLKSWIKLVRNDDCMVELTEKLGLQAAVDAIITSSYVRLRAWEEPLPSAVRR